MRDYIARDNPEAARPVALRIVEAVETLPDHPGLGRPGRVDDTRELVVSKTSYIVAYRVRHGAIEILRVIHAAMGWPARF